MAGPQAALDRYRTLVLNADHTPLEVIQWQPAIRDIISGDAYRIYDHDVDVHSSRQAWPLPSVMARQAFVRREKHPAFNRKLAVAAYWHADTIEPGAHWTCGLCGGPLHKRDITIEHVVPRYMGGKDSWDNIVLAHPACNNAKGHRSLDRSGFTLHVTPFRPSALFLSMQSVRMIASRNHEPQEWRSYLTSP